MRALILIIVLLALGAAVIVLTRTGDASIGGQQDVARIVYLLLWLVLVAGGVSSLRNRSQAAAGGPGVMTSLLIWAGLFALVVLLYRGAWFWNGIVQLAASLLR